MYQSVPIQQFFQFSGVKHLPAAELAQLNGGMFVTLDVMHTIPRHGSGLFLNLLDCYFTHWSHYLVCFCGQTGCKSSFLYCV